MFKHDTNNVISKYELLSKTDLDAIDIDTRIGNTIFIGDFE